MIKIRAVIMAGGKGSRLRPLTCGIPKPMVPIFDKPVMEYTLNLLKTFGIHDIGVTLAYLPQLVIDYYGDGNKQDMNLRYFIEEIPLGTGGSVRNAEDFLKDTFIVISGDALTDLNIKKAVKYHKDKNSMATLILKQKSIPVEYGLVITKADGRIVKFLEKPSWGEVFSDTVNTGIYILEPEVLGYYKKGDNFDFSKDLFPKLLNDGVPMFGYITQDYWCDIGDLSSYRQTHFDILDGKVKLDHIGKEVAKGIWIEKGARISNSAILKAPIYIGEKALIEDGTLIDSYSIVSRNVKIRKGNKIKRSIIWENSEIGKDSNISGAVLCSGVIVENGVSIYENTAIGHDSHLSKGSSVKPDIKIWPEKRIDENTYVTQNIIWGTKARKNIFGTRGIKGILNLDIMPELCTRLGSSFGVLMGNENTILVSSDGNPQSYIIKKLIVAGILSVGVQPIIIDKAILPMVRFGIDYFNANAGIHVYTKTAKPSISCIEFFDKSGINIDRNTERSIENLLNMDDYRRSSLEDVKSPVRVENFHEIYLKEGISLINELEEIRRRRFKLILASSSDDVFNITNRFLESIGSCVQKSCSQNIEDIADNILSKKAEIAIIIEENGEGLSLMDEKGRIIKDESYLLLTEIIGIDGFNIEELFFPYAFPITAEKIAEEYKAKVFRTSSNIAVLMREMSRNEKKLYKSLQYVFNYDAVWAIGYILEFLRRKGLNLYEVYDKIPEFHYKKIEIPCNRKEKGRIIREIINNNKGYKLELQEGVKITETGGWALLLPDKERPIFNIYSQGVSQEMAEEISADLVEKVNRLIQDNKN